MKTQNRFVLLVLLSAVQFASCKKDSKNEDPPPPAPVAVYQFNGNVENGMSGSLHGQAIGTVFNTSDRFNTPNSAITVGPAGYVRVADSDILDFPGNEFTITAWIRPTKTSVAYIVHKGETSGGGGPYSLDIHPGFVRALIHNNSDESFSIIGKTAIVDAEWQHVAMTFGNSKLTVYYNGESEGFVEADGTLQTTAGPMTIGAYEYASPGANFEGRIDNVRLYDKALTASQIKTLFIGQQE